MVFTKKFKLMKHKLTLIFALLSQTTQAENWNLGARVSTLGLAGEVGYHFNKTFALRLQGTWWEQFKKSLTFAGVQYHNVRFRPATVTLYADWYFYTPGGASVLEGDTMPLKSTSSRIIQQIQILSNDSWGLYPQNTILKIQLNTTLERGLIVDGSREPLGQ
jgi:hypothetical protein